MARRAIVSRTVVKTQVTVLGLDTVSAEPQNKTYTLSGSYFIEKKDSEGKVVERIADEKKALKDVQKAYDTDVFKNIKVVDIQTVNKLYGMWEEDFIANAFELDLNTRKPIGQSEETDAE